MLIHEDGAYMLARQNRMERLYLIDGRDNPKHAQHGTYTGLYQKYSGISSPRN